MCSSNDGIYISKGLFASPLFKKMTAEEKMYFLTAYVFSNGCGAICNDVEDIAIVAGVKNWKKIVKTLAKMELIEIKDNMFYIVEDRLLFAPDNAPTRKSYTQEVTAKVVSLVEQKKQELMNKYANSNFKFDHWRDCFNREVEYLESKQSPIEWIMGILYKVYSIIQERYKANGGYQAFSPNYFYKIAREATEATIRNNFPPPYPEKKNTDVEMELTRFHKMKAMIGGNINNTIGVGVGVLVCTAVNVILQICNIL